jgi:hypothetical protein
MTEEIKNMEVTIGNLNLACNPLKKCQEARKDNVIYLRFVLYGNFMVISSVPIKKEAVMEDWGV